MSASLSAGQCSPATQRRAASRSWRSAASPRRRPAPTGHFPAKPAPRARQHTVQTRVGGAAAASLATYNFSQRRSGTAAEWFQSAVRQIVKEADSQAPFLQTVQLGQNGAPAEMHSYGVSEAVVAAPELWQGIAEYVSHSSPDVVILVQRVSPSAAAGSPQGAMDAAQQQQQQQQQRGQRGQQGAAQPPALAGSLTINTSSSGSGGRACSPPASPPASPPGSPRSPLRVQAEDACRRLVSSGLADAILQGQVGDCCDGSGHDHSHPHPPSRASSSSSSSAAPGQSDPRQQQPAARPMPAMPAIVPFTPPGTALATSSSPAALARRTAVRAAALRPAGVPGPAAGACQQSACYFGVVVQSRSGQTGAEGCYLLKTVKNVSPGTGCSCTHFSLTRISAGDHLEQQFVNSWLL